MKARQVCSGNGLKVALAFLVLTLAQSAVARSANQLVFQYVGRNIVTSACGLAGQAFTLGYYTYIAGIPQPLFSDSGTVSEADAYFTFRSEPYTFSTFANGDTLVRTVTPGFLLHLYYNETPDQDFDEPATFSDGQLIATFKVLTSQATRVGDAASQQGSLELVSSRPFRFQGKIYMIRNIVQKGVTQVSSGPAVPYEEGVCAFAFSGSALAY
jgi:hypothetical protein